MSYVIRDPLGPALATYAKGKRFRARVAKYWPTRDIDGIKVFASLPVWDSSNGVNKSENNLKLYKLLGITVKQLEENDYKGLKKAYLKVNPITSEITLTDTEIGNFLNDATPQIYPNNENVFSSDPATPKDENHNPDPYQNNPLYVDIADANGDIPADALPEPQWDQYGWITDFVIYQPTKLLDSTYIGNPTDQEIIDIVNTGDPKYISISDIEYTSPIFFAALSDTDNLLYEKKMTIVKKDLIQKDTLYLNAKVKPTHKTTSYILQEAVIKVEYRRIQDATDAAVAPLIAKIQNLINELNSPVTISFKGVDIDSQLFQDSNIAEQIRNMKYTIQGYEPDQLNYKNHLRYDETVVMYAKQFSVLFAGQIKFGYTKKPATFWQKAVSVFVSIVVVIVVVVLVITGQVWAVPIALSAGALLQSGLAMYWAGRGEYAAATYAGKHAQYLSTAAEYSGYITAIYAKLWNTLALMTIGKMLELGHASEDIQAAFKVITLIALAAEGRTDTAAISEETSTNTADVTVQSVDKITEPTMEQISKDITDMVESVHIQTLLNRFTVKDWMSLLNTGYEYYINAMNPAPKLDKLAAKVAAQNKELKELEGPEVMDTVEREFSDPYDNYIDFNSKIDKMPQAMTHGLNAALMNTYFNTGY